jgi:hypothetical protein
VGTCSVVATDVTHPSITGSQTNIDVVAAQQSGTVTASGHDGQVSENIAITSSVVKDAYGNLVSGVTVTFSITKPDGTVITLTGLTNSSGIASTVLSGDNTNLAGSYLVTASAPAMVSGAATVFTITSAETPTAATHLEVEGITDPIKAGAASQVIVTALDSNNNTVTDYTGTVTFSSDCANVTLPSNYTFQSADSGTHTFANSVSFLTAGTCKVTASDVTHPSITGSQTDVDVIAGQQTGTITASGHDGEVRDDITITSSAVTDVFGNLVNGLTVTFSVTKPDGVVITLSGTTNTNGVANGILVGDNTNLAGIYRVTAAASNLTTGATTTFSITIPVVPPTPEPEPEPAPTPSPTVTHLMVKDILDPITAGQASQITVIALDIDNNQVTGYRGTISFVADCGNVILPGHYTFTETDSGQHTFLNGVTFYQAGTCSVTARRNL